jgi:hypothetical protein
MEPGQEAGAGVFRGGGEQHEEGRVIAVWEVAPATVWLKWNEGGHVEVVPQAEDAAVGEERYRR